MENGSISSIPYYYKTDITVVSEASPLFFKTLHPLRSETKLASLTPCQLHTTSTFLSRSSTSNIHHAIQYHSHCSRRSGFSYASSRTQSWLTCHMTLPLTHSTRLAASLVLHLIALLRSKVVSRRTRSAEKAFPSPPAPMRSLSVSRT